MPDDLPPITPQPLAWQDVPRGRVLAFAPHPDDEIAGPGGCLALHRRAGDFVRVAVASTGAAGDPDGRYAAADYVQMRERESRAGLAELGVDDAVYWRMPDNMELSASDLELGTQLAVKTIGEAAPDIIYLPWAREGHSDHHYLHFLVVAALRRLHFGGRAFGYEIWNAMVPDVVVDITPVAEPKRRAIRAHASQLAYTDFEHTILGLNAYRSMVHQRGRGFGEALCFVTW